MMPRPPVVLAILDGFGEAEPGPANAITLAQPTFWNGLRERYPLNFIDCSGVDVGLPCGLMGNSEVGHLNMGAGRIVWQEITRIDRAIEDGSFFENAAFRSATDHALRTGGRLHLFGLLSDGGVHSSMQHVIALCEFAARRGLGAGRVVLHAFLDGRDTPPKSALTYLEQIEREFERIGTGRVGSVIGRFYAMDRDKRWDRVARAYLALARGEGLTAPDAVTAVQAAYARGETDEFVAPTLVGADPTASRVCTEDAVIFFNFRTDRPRELTDAFVADDDFREFERGSDRPRPHFVTMTRYREDLPCPVAFTPQNLRGIFPEVVSAAGLRQLRIAETEKYAHVTFFFSGGDEREFPGERRILVPSPRVRTYDEQPAMSAPEVTDRLLAELACDQPPDVVILNYANADMVGHTGNLDAAIASVRALDACLARLVPSVTARGGYIAITADHGNCEMMVDPITGEPHTAHTTNPVPLLLAGPDLGGRRLRDGGRLCDIVTTLMPLLGLQRDPSMEGVDLLA